MNRSNLPTSDDELAALVAGRNDYPLCVTKPHDNWDSKKKYADLTARFKQAYDDGGLDALASEIERVGESVAQYAYDYNERDAEPKERESLGTACNEVVPRFGRGAVTELIAERDLPGTPLREDDPDAPLPPEGREDWEDAGWDVVMYDADSGKILPVQVKATKYEPDEDAAKDAAAVYWIPVDGGEYDTEKADWV